MKKKIIGSILFSILFSGSTAVLALENVIHKLAIKDTLEIYAEEGVQGLAKSVRECYEETYKKTGNMFCLAKDMASKTIDDAGASYYGIENQEVFTIEVAQHRYYSACRDLLKRKDCDVFLPKMYKSISDETLRQSAAP